MNRTGLPADAGSGRRRAEVSAPGVAPPRSSPAPSRSRSRPSPPASPEAPSRRPPVTAKVTVTPRHRSAAHVPHQHRGWRPPTAIFTVALCVLTERAAIFIGGDLARLSSDCCRRTIRQAPRGATTATVTRSVGNHGVLLSVGVAPLGPSRGAVRRAPCTRNHYHLTAAQRPSRELCYSSWCRRPGSSLPTAS